MEPFAQSSPVKVFDVMNTNKSSLPSTLLAAAFCHMNLVVPHFQKGDASPRLLTR